MEDRYILHASYMVVRWISGQDTVVGGDPVVERLYVSVFQGGHQGRRLEHRAGLGVESDGHVVGLAEAPVRGIPHQVDHGPDSTGLDIHDHGAAHLDGLVVLYLPSEGTVHDILHCDVQGGPDVEAVFRLDIQAVVILDTLPVVGRPGPHLAFLAVEHIVILALETYVVVAVGVAVVLDISDGTPGEGTVGILAGILLHDDHSALVLAFVHEGESPETDKRLPVHGVAQPKVLVPVFPSLLDKFPVVLTVSSHLGGKSLRELLSLGLPFGLKLLAFPALALEIVLAHGAVHEQLVHGGGHRQEFSVLTDNGTSFRIYYGLDADRTEIPLYGLVRLP